MIKACMIRGDGRVMLLLGLSKRNTELLLEGRPILVDTREMAREPGMGYLPDLQIALVGGETEGDILQELKQHFELPHPIEPPQSS